MDADGLKELFAPFGAVTVKRMFGGHGVYADGLCFAVEIGRRGLSESPTPSRDECLRPPARRRSSTVRQGRAGDTSFWRLPAQRLRRRRRTAADGARSGDARRRDARREAKAKPRARRESRRRAREGRLSQTVASAAATQRSVLRFEGSRRRRRLTGRRRKLGTWSPSPMTGASTSRRGRCGRGGVAANPEVRGTEVRSDRAATTALSRRALSARRRLGEPRATGRQGTLLIRRDALAAGDVRRGGVANPLGCSARGGPGVRRPRRPRRARVRAPRRGAAVWRFFLVVGRLFAADLPFDLAFDQLLDLVDRARSARVDDGQRHAGLAGAAGAADAVDVVLRSDAARRS